MNTWKKWVIGIAIILAAIAGAVVKLLDGDPNTNPDPAAVVAEVKKGVDTIREDGAEPEPVPAPMENQ